MIILATNTCNFLMNIVVDIATIITGLSAIGAIIISIITIRKNTKTIKAQNLIELRNMFSEKDRVEIHAALRVQGELKNWVAIDDYLGVFELCFVLIEDGHIDLKSFKSQYGYRLGNILFHDQIIYYKLLLEFEFWENFYSLINHVYPNSNIDRLKSFAIKIRSKYNWKEFIDIGPNAFIMELNESDRQEISEILKEMRGNLQLDHLVL